MLAHQKPDDWVLASGETHTVEEFVKLAFESVGMNWSEYVKTSEKYYRPNEVNHLLGDPTKAKTELGWEPELDFRGLVELMVESDIKLAKQEKILMQQGLIKPTWESPKLV